MESLQTAWPKILAAVAKELLLLRRDRAALLVLFIMPAVLVVVLTLVQENIMGLTGQEKTRALFLDLDGGRVGRSLQEALAGGEGFELTVLDGRQVDETELRQRVRSGEHQVGIVVLADASRRLRSLTGRLVRSLPDRTEVLSPVRVVFDPGSMAALRAAVTARLRMALQMIALEDKLAVLDRELNQGLADLGLPPETVPAPFSSLGEILARPVLTLEAETADAKMRHDPVQQNVPAWALFGIFFTAIPVAVTILQERNSGIRIRLESLPVSPLVLFTGKVAAYIGVCVCQFLLIALLGMYLFPFLGLPAFDPGPAPLSLLVVIVAAGLAASGYGIFLGTVCSSHEQAAALGPTTIVAAAAIGGIMVPVYTMPPVMRKISVVSPLNWGLNSFQELLLRGNGLGAITDDLLRLALFFLVTVLLAWKLART